jgi:hypothetical protein
MLDMKKIHLIIRIIILCLFLYAAWDYATIKLYQIPDYKKTIEEMNSASKSDTAYCSSLYDYSQGMYQTHKICNQMNVGLLKNTITDAQLMSLMEEYGKIADETKKKEEEVTRLLKENEELKKTFRFVQVKE